MSDLLFGKPYILLTLKRYSWKEETVHKIKLKDKICGQSERGVLFVCRLLMTNKQTNKQKHKQTNKWENKPI